MHVSVTVLRIESILGLYAGNMLQAVREFVKGHVRSILVASWERLYACYELVGRVNLFVIDSNEQQA